MDLIVKICGITRLEDARLALEAGADRLGFNFWPKSPRCLEPNAAGEILSSLGERGEQAAVAVFVDADLDHVKEICRLTGIRTVQLHGGEDPNYCRRLIEDGYGVIKAVRIASDEDLAQIDRYSMVKTFLLDAKVEGALPGGTGRSFDWSMLNGLSERVSFLLAGGLTPDNVAASIRQTRPYGVDTASGVESSPGIKDPKKVREFIKNAKGAVNG